MSVNPFPVGIAHGAAFLNREQEQQALQYNIEAGRHTLLLSPRRYGKSSLVKYTLTKLALPFADVDLFLTTDVRSVERRIIQGLNQLLTQLSSTPEQWLKELLHFFKKSQKQWTVGITGVSVQLQPDENADVAENLVYALRAVDKVLQKKKQRAVLFIDEMQEIATLDAAKGIEGAVRHFAQESSQLVFIFSGSNRHMLQHMFSDRARPLYELCDQITLERVSAAVYQKYLNHLAKKTWNTLLPEPSFAKLIELTQCHARRMYALCAQVWQMYSKQKTPPTAGQIEKLWLGYAKMKAKDILSELSNLSNSQIKVLFEIAAGDTLTLTGKRMQRKLGLSGSAISQALVALEQKDYIERVAGSKSEIIDPLIKAVLLLQTA